MVNVYQRIKETESRAFYLYSGKIVLRCWETLLPSALSEEELANPHFLYWTEGWMGYACKKCRHFDRGAICELEKCLKDKTTISPTRVYHPTNCTCRVRHLLQPIFVTIRVHMERERLTKLMVFKRHIYVD